MRIATNNRLAHYQVEYQELNEQTAMLRNQLPGLEAQIAQLGNYLSVNGGDRMARSEYAKFRQRYSSISSAIRRNIVLHFHYCPTHYQTLQRQIAGEANKAMYGRTGTRRSGYYY